MVASCGEQFGNDRSWSDFEYIDAVAEGARGGVGGDDGLVVAVVAPCDDGSVVFHRDAVGGSGGDGDDVAEAGGDGGLAGVCASPSSDVTIGLKNEAVLAVGWKLNLVANSDHASVWSADELFDAGNMGVANSARDYADKDIRYEGPLDDPDAILSSPSRFSQYTLRTLLATMPAR